MAIFAKSFYIIVGQTKNYIYESSNYEHFTPRLPLIEYVKERVEGVSERVCGASTDQHSVIAPRYPPGSFAKLWLSGIVLIVNVGMLIALTRRMLV